MNRRLKIGLLGEGKTELGESLSNFDPKKGGKIIPREKEGALHTLVRRELQQLGFDCDFIHRHPSKNELIKKIIRTGHTILKPKYLKEIVVRWKPEEIDAIIIVADADKILSQRENQLKSALKTIRDTYLYAQEKSINDKSIGGLAIRNFETWLLADKKTIEDILQVDISELTNLETLENTKNIVEEAIEKSNYLTEEKNSQRPFQIRWNLAHEVNLQKIRENCPQGYGKFIISLEKVANIFQPK